jgi:uncharacterized protein involved in outer membrane biogenesis
MVPDGPKRCWRSFEMPRITRGRAWIAASLLVVIALVVATSYAVDPMLQRQIEDQMNRKLKGYTARIGRVSFHPLGFGITLYDLVWSQDAHPDPPVFQAPRLGASVQWKALIHGRVVASFELAKPQIYADQTHFKAEAKDPTPVTQHGWQEAFDAIYPLKINHVRVDDGQIQYVDKGQTKPIKLSRLNLVAENIRNVRSRERVYPSELHLDSIVFDTGKIVVDGNADFLAEPYAGVTAQLALDGVQLDYAKPILEHYGVVLNRGTLSANGHVEYAPTIKVVELQQATFRDLNVTYVVTNENTGDAQKAAQKTVESTKQSANKPDLFLRIGELRVVNGEVAVENKTGLHPYQLFLTHTNVTVQKFSNQKSEGVGTVKLTGKFMGSGDTNAVLAFLPESQGPNFNLDLKVEDTDLTRLNDLLRAYGKFDVAAGQLSVYSQMKVASGHVDGYVKPLFRDVKVSAPETKDAKTVGQRVKEKVIGAAFKILKNRPRKEVATQVNISGPLQNTQASTWQAVVGLLRNAFVKAILPGFDREVAGPRSGGAGAASPRTPEK